MQSIALAIGFLTRIPMPTGEVSPKTMARALVFFPWVGMALGGATALFANLAYGHVPAALTAVLIIAVLAAVTGALHLDGVADVFDGLGGGRGDKARTLEIMRDSRIGAHGACALMLLLATKVIAATYLVQANTLTALWAAPMVARTAVLPLIVLFPYARPQGLGTNFRSAATPWHVLAGFLLMAPVLAIAGPHAGAPALASLLTALALAAMLQRKLGGLTGDVYGASIELAEAAYLAAACCEGTF